ncbi:ATP-binding cassette domain-containing protein [Desulfosporosinus fructosivorans]|uniref:ATP-binding cassette domain-containing protein n=1 Tax=Desulfosporosinus fructosivorans TaxID=2018669 RepID=A0A4Z0R067_9FIRM|nr:ATP-binding cassette domain-containing protein [Desulfosporosinus fructosivorans]TGE35929.1 ATP-binding cassette domain-containing protein [Desulfosporosinus fructosivorans]
MKALQVQNVRYGSILNGVSFKWHQGEIVALMGANGSGKSTLARLIAGLIEPTAGEILLTVDGTPCPWNRVKRWQEIGLVGQHPRRQTIGATVAEELGFGLLNLGHDIHWVRNRVRELASTVGLGGKEDQSPSTLSGGERQRLVTTAILALQPSFLILDEALTMLDALSQANVLELLFQAQTETGQLWITHDPEFARLADRLLVINNGTIIDMGKPRDAFANRKLHSLYSLGETYANLDSLVPKHPQTKVGEVQGPSELTQPVLEWNHAKYESRLMLNKNVRAGEFIGIVGPSGSGKTTLLDSAIGFILPTEGKLLVCGEKMSKDSLKIVRRKTRLVLQEAGEYLIGGSVYHEVFYGDSRRDLLSERQARLSYLEDFGIPSRLIDEAPERLSGGERQMVALASALRTLPKILLLDEPLLGLDTVSRARIQTMISAWTNLTILYVTHDLREVLQYADRLWLVENGNVVLDCPIECWKDHQEQFRASGVRC